MPHRGLNRPKRSARGTQVGAEDHSERVNVDDAVSFVTLEDACGSQIAVEDTRQSGRDMEQGRSCIPRRQCAK